MVQVTSIFNRNDEVSKANYKPLPALKNVWHLSQLDQFYSEILSDHTSADRKVNTTIEKLC